MKQKRVSIVALGLSFAIIVLVLFNFLNQQTDYLLKEKTDSSKIIKSVVFKSFQKTDENKFDKDPIAKQKRSIASVRINKNLPQKVLTINRVQKEISKPSFQLNGNKYYWLNDYEAKLSPGLINENFANGYEIKKLSKEKINFEVFNSKSLNIIKSGSDYKIVTGAFIIQYSKNADLKNIIESFGLLEIYQAPQIQTIILQAQNGQNLFDIQTQLRSLPFVKNVDLEILGRGDRIQ